MELELVPDPGPAVFAAFAGALVRERVDIDHVPSAHQSRWRAAGLAEGVERGLAGGIEHGRPVAVRADYGVLSPRSTRGATRA
jgi:hypothetical protein